MATEIRLAEIIEALSHALDMTEGQPAGHCVRCCHIGTAIGRQLGLSEGALRDLYYTLLLKDLGCSSNAARICELYLADDLKFKRDFKLVDGTFPQVLKFVLSHTGMQAGLAERFRGLVNILKNGQEIATSLIHTRCQRGADIARQMRFSEAVAQGILDLDEHFDGGGKPLGKAGNDIHIFARIALMAQIIDIFFSASGPEAAVAEVIKRSGGWFDPVIVEAFLRSASEARFWTDLVRPDIEQIVLAAEPGQQQIFADEDYLDDIAAGFARVIDAKSPYTAGHSDRVALFSDMIAEQLDMQPAQRRRLKRAALLHDIGKLGVSNAVLDKPGRLIGDEWEQMKRHAQYSEAILSRISAFADIAKIGGSHHEKLDGTGYPRGLRGDEISFDVRIVATADVFDALTADRPYRAALPVHKALEILWETAGRHHDASCINALERALNSAQLIAA
ncbi:HD-GYP domain-containing protein [Rhizobium sp. AAP43]|uniref:HD-GYP domain-containing protein n=1 Tax=Rhizobium sp. AAP43 TaxID=1523420 RepID=UPI0006B960BD|nr:HD-GYP domain-containing protein [Rhizobium sp. AAP43]KPF45576.1 metal-dependent phosphohydrolase [Rhizobium sp. AAP43]